MKNNVIIAAMLLCASVNLAQNSNQSKGHKNMGAAVNMPVPFTVNVADSLTWFLKIDDRNYSYTSNTPRDVLIKVFCTWYNFSSLATVDNKVYFANKAFDIDRNVYSWL